MKKTLFILLLALLLLCPYLSGAEEVTLDSRIAYISGTYECGCSYYDYGVMISRNGLLTKSRTFYCPDHGKKFSKLDFYFGYADEDLYIYHYSGDFFFRAYELFKKGYNSENDIAYVRFNEAVGETTGWFRCILPSDEELKNATIVIRSNTEDGYRQATLSGVTVEDRKFLKFPYIKGLAVGIPAFKLEEGGNSPVIGLCNSYTNNDQEQSTYIRRITNQVYKDMKADGLFKSGAETQNPVTTKLTRAGAADYADDDEVSYTGTSQDSGDTTSANTTVADAGDSGDKWTCPECEQEGNTGNFCSYCGTAKPDDSGNWTCPSCGQTGNIGNFCYQCGTSRYGDNASAGSTQTTTVNQNLEQIPGETEKVKVKLTSTSASDFIPYGQDPTRWQPSNATDGNQTTCWQYSWSDGQYLEMSIGTGETVDEIWFKNGFWAYNDKGAEQYSINARPKAVTIRFLYSGESTYRDDRSITLADAWGSDWQRFDVGHHENVIGVRVVVNSIYKGSYFKYDVCLSEAMLVQHASAETATAAQGEQAAVVYESRPDITGCALLDRLSTRSGPGTNFGEPGTFFRNDAWRNQTVKVLKKAKGSGVWWVQVEFQNGNGGYMYRVWTGKKRVDVDLDKVTLETPIGKCEIKPTGETYWGPGTNYAPAVDRLATHARGTLYEVKNGFADVEYYCDNGVRGRVWVHEDAVYNVIPWTEK